MELRVAVEKTVVRKLGTVTRRGNWEQNVVGEQSVLRITTIVIEDSAVRKQSMIRE